MNQHGIHPKIIRAVNQCRMNLMVLLLDDFQFLFCHYTKEDSLYMTIANFLPFHIVLKSLQNKRPINYQTFCIYQLNNPPTHHIDFQDSFFLNQFFVCMGKELCLEQLQPLLFAPGSELYGNRAGALRQDARAISKSGQSGVGTLESSARSQTVNLCMNFSI